MTSSDDDDLAGQLEQMTDDARNALPFGVIGLDSNGKVWFYSRREAELSGYGDRPVKDLDFFREVAPCMNTEDFRGRVMRELEAGELDIEIGHTGDFSDRSRFMRVRVMSGGQGRLWLANQR